MSRKAEEQKVDSQSLEEKPGDHLVASRIGTYQYFWNALVGNGWDLGGNVLDENAMRRLFWLASKDNARASALADKLYEIVKKRVYNLHDKNEIYRDLGNFLKETFPKKEINIKNPEVNEGNDLRYYLETMVSKTQKAEEAQMRTQRHVGNVKDVIDEIQSIDIDNIPEFPVRESGGQRELDFSRMTVSEHVMNSCANQFRKRFGTLMKSQNPVGGEKNIFQFINHHFKLVKPGAKHSVNLEKYIQEQWSAVKKKNQLKLTKEQEAKYLDGFAAAYLLQQMYEQTSDLYFEPYVNQTKKKYDRHDPVAQYLNVTKKKKVALEDLPPALLEYDVQKPKTQVEDPERITEEIIEQYNAVYEPLSLMGKMNLNVAKELNFHALQEPYDIEKIRADKNREEYVLLGTRFNSAREKKEYRDCVESFDKMFGDLKKQQFSVYQQGDAHVSEEDFERLFLNNLKIFTPYRKTFSEFTKEDMEHIVDQSTHGKTHYLSIGQEEQYNEIVNNYKKVCIMRALADNKAKVIYEPYCMVIGQDGREHLQQYQVGDGVSRFLDINHQIPEPEIKVEDKEKQTGSSLEGAKNPYAKKEEEKTEQFQNLHTGVAEKNAEDEIDMMQQSASKEEVKEEVVQENKLQEQKDTYLHHLEANGTVEKAVKEQAIQFIKDFRQYQYAKHEMIKELQEVKQQFMSVEQQKNLALGAEGSGSGLYQNMAQALEKCITALENRHTMPGAIESAIKEYGDACEKYYDKRKPLFGETKDGDAGIRLEISKRGQKRAYELVELFDNYRREVENSPYVSPDPTEQNAKEVNEYDIALKCVALEDIYQWKRSKVTDDECSKKYEEQNSKAKEQMQLKRDLEKVTKRKMNINYATRYSHAEIFPIKNPEKKRTPEKCAMEYLAQDYAHLLVDADATVQMLKEARESLHSKTFEEKAKKIAKDPVFKNVVEKNGTIDYFQWSAVSKGAEKIMQEQHRKLVGWGAFDSNLSLVDVAIKKQEKYTENDIEKIYEKLGEIVMAQICSTQPYVVEGILIHPTSEKEFLQETVQAIKNHEDYSVLQILAGDSVPKDALKDIKDSLEKDLKSYKLRDTVVKSIRQEQGMEVSKVSTIKKENVVGSAKKKQEVNARVRK